MKYLFLVFFALLSVVALAQIPTNGLIGGWPFTGNANDMSGSGNNGTVVGALLTADRFGNANCAYKFNGINDHIMMQSAGPTGPVSRSVSFWARTTNTVIQIGLDYGSAVNGGIFQILFNYNCQGVGVDNSTAALIRGNTTLTDNNWHHIVAVLNAATGAQLGNIAFYVDAVLQTSITCFVTSTTSVANSNSAFPIAIGRGSSAAVRPFNGDLDDFYFYNRPLSVSEVQALYNYMPCAAAPLTPAPVIGNNLLCSGVAQVFSVAPVSGAISYTWSLPNGWSGTSAGNTISVVPNTGAGSISVAAINPCGQSPFSTLFVSAAALPAVSLSGNFAICSNGVATLTASGAGSYSWSTGSQAPVITVSPSATTIYTVWGVSAGCSNMAVQQVSVSNAPAPVIQVNGPPTACPGVVVNMGAGGASVYTWQPGNLSGFFVAVSLTATTVYTVTGTDNNGCMGTGLYTQLVEVCTGLPQAGADQPEALLYPNPSNSVVVVRNSGFGKLEMYNAQGACMHTAAITGAEHTIDLSGFGNGLYFIRLSGNKGAVVKTLLKQ